MSGYQILFLMACMFISGFGGAWYIQELRMHAKEAEIEELQIQAQNDVIKKAQTSTEINTKIGEDYVNKVNSIIRDFTIASMSSRTVPNSVPKVSGTTSKPNACACNCAKLKANIQLCNIQVMDWQKWYKEQAVVYNK